MIFLAANANLKYPLILLAKTSLILLSCRLCLPVMLWKINTLDRIASEQMISTLLRLSANNLRRIGSPILSCLDINSHTWLQLILNLLESFWGTAWIYQISRLKFLAELSLMDRKNRLKEALLQNYIEPLKLSKD